MSSSLVSLSTSNSSRQIAKPGTPISATSTPAKQNEPSATPSPGLWTHPRIQEIAERQRKSTFDGDNVKTILWNALAFIVMSLLRSSLTSIDSIQDNIVAPIHNVSGDMPVHLFHLFLAINVGSALMPLFRGKDNLSDIDLTPSQRSLLGLDPNATPPMTPSTKYITPPRYARSSTPRSGTPSSRGSSQAGSPLAYKASGSPSPQVTPLWQKAVGQSGSRRNSYGFLSVSGTALKDSSVFAPQTPSPVGRNSGVPISSKWVYNRGRSMSGSKSIF